MSSGAQYSLSCFSSQCKGARLCALMCIALSGKGDYEEAFADLEAARKLSDRLGDKVWKSRIFNTLSWVFGELYNLESAIRYNHEGVEYAWKLGDPEIIRRTRQSSPTLENLSSLREFLFTIQTNRTSCNSLSSRPPSN